MGEKYSIMSSSFTRSVYGFTEYFFPVWYRSKWLDPFYFTTESLNQLASTFSSANKSLSSVELRFLLEYKGERGKRTTTFVSHNEFNWKTKTTETWSAPKFAPLESLRPGYLSPYEKHPCLMILKTISGFNLKSGWKFISQAFFIGNILRIFEIRVGCKL